MIRSDVILIIELSLSFRVTVMTCRAQHSSKAVSANTENLFSLHVKDYHRLSDVWKNWSLFHGNSAFQKGKSVQS